MGRQTKEADTQEAPEGKTKGLTDLHKLTEGGKGLNQMQTQAGYVFICD